MKRLFCPLLIILLLISVLPAAMAVTAEADVPDDVLAFYAANSYWESWRIVGWTNPSLPEGGRCDDGFALLRSDDRYDMARFGYADGHWTFEDNNPAMLPQTSAPVRIVDQTEQLVSFALMIGKKDSETLELHFMRTDEGEWRLFYARSESPRVAIDTETRGLFLYNGYAEDGSAYRREVALDFPLGFRDFVFDRFPLLPDDAEAYLANERGKHTPVELAGARGNFPRDLLLAVYQGPSSDYGRSGGGKGSVSTNGDVVCYGTWKDALLVSYAISDTKSRFGWILPDEVPTESAKQIAPFSFASYGDAECDYLCGVLTSDCELTDDPDQSQAPLGSLGAGTSVHCLAHYGDWLYIEGYAGTQLAMGFVPASRVDLERGYAVNAQHIIDQATVYAEDDILSAMAVVEAFVCESRPGYSIISLTYTEEDSADKTSWWWEEGAQNGKEGIKLYSDLNAISLTDYEIADYGTAQDYGWILYRAPGGEWTVGNCGYE